MSYDSTEVFAWNLKVGTIIAINNPERIKAEGVSFTYEKGYIETCIDLWHMGEKVNLGGSR